jgi:hypothetical protein
MCERSHKNFTELILLLDTKNVRLFIKLDCIQTSIISALYPTGMVLL